MRRRKPSQTQKGVLAIIKTLGLSEEIKTRVQEEAQIEWISFEASNINTQYQLKNTFYSLFHLLLFYSYSRF